MNNNPVKSVRDKSWNADAEMKVVKTKKKGQYYIECQYCGQRIRKKVRIVEPQDLKRGQTFYFWAIGNVQYGPNLVKGVFLTHESEHLIYWNHNSPVKAMSCTRCENKRLPTTYFVEIKLRKGKKKKKK